MTNNRHTSFTRCLTDKEAQEVAESFNRSMKAVEEAFISFGPVLMESWREFEQILVDLKVARFKENNGH